MQITYDNKQAIEFTGTLRARVKKYFDDNGINRFGNPNMWIKTLFMFLLLFTPYFLMMTGVADKVWSIAICWVLMGLGTAGIGLSIMHDANHRSYSSNQVVNRLLSYTMNLLGGFYLNWQYQHNILHHNFTNIDGHDEDIDAGDLLRFSPNQPHLKIHRFQHIYAWFIYGLMTLSWTITMDFKQMARYKENKKKYTQGRSVTSVAIELVISKIIYYLYILVLPIIFLPIPWYLVLVFYFMMHFICGLTLAVIFQTAHVMPTTEFPQPDPEGHINRNWAIHQLMTTTDYAPKSRVLSWLIGGLNYQVVHHLFPAVCHVHYRKLAPIIRDTAAEYNIPYHVQPTFFAAVAEHYRMLKNLGRKNN